MFHVSKQFLCSLDHTLSLFGIGIITTNQGMYGTMTDIYMLETAQQVIHHAFTQRTIRINQMINSEHIKYSIENGNPSRQYRAAVFFETFEFHIRDIFIFEQFVFEFFQAFTSELFFVIAPAHIDTNLTTGLDRAT